VTDLVEYGAGVPRYWAVWALLLPGVVWAARRLALPRPALALLVATTLPTLAMHFAGAPADLPFPVRWAGSVAALAAIGVLAWRARDAAGAESAAAVRRGPAVPLVVGVLALVLAAVGVRAGLMRWDPGQSDISASSEEAARQLLDGRNPYVEENPFTIAPVYQYPAGTLLSYVPFTAAIGPDPVGGEGFLAARAATWAVDVAVVLALVAAGVRAATGRPALRGGRVPLGALLPAAAYALHPAIARETGLTGANDVLMGVAVAAFGWVLAVGGSTAAAAAALGLAIAVKPPALVLLPLLWRLRGLRAAAAAAAVPALLQLPFALWPEPQLGGLLAILEPAVRVSDGYDVVRFSLWWPLYAVAGLPEPLLRGLGVVAAGAAGLLALVLGQRLRPAGDRGPGAAHPPLGGPALAAACLPVLVVFLLAPAWRVNFLGWSTVPAVLLALWPALCPLPTGTGAAAGAGADLDRPAHGRTHA
jgi:hypothetical protein